MNNYVLFILLATCITAFCKRPNVILIVTDDQGYGDLSCHGNPILKTPELDKLHSESIRLTNFHVSSFCTPSRAARTLASSAGLLAAQSFCGAKRSELGRS